MPKYLEWDFDNPKHRQRRRRQPLPLGGEVLGLEPEVESTPRIRVEVVVHRRQRQQRMPPWVIVLLIVAALMWISPLGTVIALVMISVLVAEHPTVGIALLAMPVLVIVIALRQRWRGEPF